MDEHPVVPKGVVIVVGVAAAAEGVVGVVAVLSAQSWVWTATGSRTGRQQYRQKQKQSLSS